MDVANYIAGRTNDQCRDRWKDVSSASSSKKAPKTTWSQSEDDTLLSAHEQLGTSWEKVAREVGGDKTAELVSPLPRQLNYTNLTHAQCRLRHNVLKRQGKTTNVTNTQVDDDIDGKEAPLPGVQVDATDVPSQGTGAGMQPQRDHSHSELASTNKRTASSPAKRGRPKKVKTAEEPVEEVEAAEVNKAAVESGSGVEPLRRKQPGRTAKNKK
jgi:hypothetical protein